MPAVYQLVPGSIIAKFWFSAIFYENTYLKEGESNPNSQESVFANLMVTSASIALGLILGFALFQSAIFIVGRSFFRRDAVKDDHDNFKLGRSYISHKQGMMEGMYTAVHDANDDPDSMRIIKRGEGRRSLVTESRSLFSLGSGEPETPESRKTT